METDTISPVVVAKIIKPHGLSGEVVLESYTDVEGRLDEPRIYLLMNQAQTIGKLTVESVRFFGGRYVIKFQGISSRTEAENLRNKELAIPEEEIGDLPSDHYFIHELVGMNVLLRDGKKVGTITSVLETGGVDLLEIGDKILIPFAAEICVEVDLQKREILIDPPEGLLQLNAR
jgi:16S rRNA processing protein RimM